MNGFVFWPDEPTVSLVSLLIRDGDLWLGIRNDKDEIVAFLPIREHEATGMRAVFNEMFGDEDDE